MKTAWYTQFDMATGEASGSFHCDADSAQLNTKEGHWLVEGHFSSLDGYCINGLFVPYMEWQRSAKAAQGAAGLVWSNESMSWQDTRSLVELKEAKRAELKMRRDSSINGGFVWDGSRFDSDPISQTRLLGLKLKALGDSTTVESWRLQDNSWRVLNAQNALAVWEAFEKHLRTCFQRFANLEVLVHQAATAEAVAAVIWFD